MRSTVVLLLATVALVGATGAVAAADGQSAGGVEVTERADSQSESPPWPVDETTTGNSSDGDDALEDDSTSSGSASSDFSGGDSASSNSASSNSASSNSASSNSASDDSSGAVTPNEDSSDESNSDQDETTQRETTSVSPGQQLAGAVGAQGASVQGELWNRTLSERLSAASTPDERAEVVADETETIETYLDALEAVRANITGAWESGEMTEGEYRAALSEFVVRAHSVERRANQTLRAAERLPAGVRERNDIDVTHIRKLAQQAHDLYQFENPIARQVANETLTNQSALAGVLPEGERANQNRTRTGE